MSTAVAATPVLIFAAAVGVRLTLVGGSQTSGHTVYTATYDVADANVLKTGVTIDVSGAQDANGNTQQDYTAQPTSGIDTLYPTVTDVPVNELLISDADAGTGHFTVAVTFDEAMSTALASTPVLTFAPAVAETPTLPALTLHDALPIYTATYDVADANVLKTGVTIDVSGAQDANGNTQQD